MDTICASNQGKLVVGRRLVGEVDMACHVGVYETNLKVAV
jgi:hypothetical protein